MTRLVVLEGPDGSGKSTLTDALASALGARYYHHPPPPLDSDAWAAALHYASAREALRRECWRASTALVVTDRGAWSTLVLGHVLGGTEQSLLVALACVREVLL